MKLGAALLVLVAVICAHDGRVAAQPDPAQSAPDVPANKADATPSSPDTTTVPLVPTPETKHAAPLAAIGTCDADAKAVPDVAGVPAAPPVAWADYEVTGELARGDDDATVHALLSPTMSSHHALTATARAEIATAAAAFGYQLVSITTRDLPTGARAIVAVAPLPIVRKVDIDLHQGVLSGSLSEEVKRRMRLRAGTYLPWKPTDRECTLQQEKARVEEYLRDEGFFRAAAKITHTIKGNGVTVIVDVSLGAEYELGTIKIKDAGALAVDEDKIRNVFVHSSICFIKCFGTARFKRTQHQADIQSVIEMFHKVGYPAVRVQSDFNRGASPDHVTHRVNITLTIDQRRHLDVQFEGNDPDRVTDEQLKAQLTFDNSGSSDDTEATDSARAITVYLQGRGFFDAHVTWTRERFTALDQIVYRISLGAAREVKSIDFVGNKALTEDDLSDVIGTKATKLSRSLFGASSAATADGLSGDIDRLLTAYRQAGYRDARVSVAAATDPAAVGNAALTAAFAVADHGSGIYVRYTIDEGEPTVVSQVELAIGPAGETTLATAADRELCDQLLTRLAELIGDKHVATRSAPDKCVATTTVKFKEDDLSKTPDLLRDWLWNHGRPRATVEYAATQSGPHAVVAHYKIKRTDKLKVGKIVIRGNFKTRTDVIAGELENNTDGPTPDGGGRPYALAEGDPLNQTALAEAGRRLRATGLFNDVHVEFPDLDTTGEETVNGVVTVQERYDYRAQVDFEVGYSSYSGLYTKAIGALKNIYGTGISLDVSGTIGTQFIPGNFLSTRAVDSTVRIPRWIARDLTGHEFSTELTAFYREQSTPAFGELTTEGITLSLSRSWPRPRTKEHPQRSITFGFFKYDFRVRNRQIDALRPPDGDDDQAQVPVSTQTGSLGETFEWEQRVDHNGTLSPLAPEAGFRLEGGWSLAHPYLLSQDTFIKVHGAGQIYHLVGSNLLLRGDLRYDQGVPLGGAVLLPDVERFFAGGDADVRGYNDDQLAHEIIQVAVPPVGTLSQIRVVPAGGNIRAMMSVDAQVRIYKLFASAMFFDMGTITNQWSTWQVDQLRPSVGMAFLRAVTPFGAFAFEYAVPLHPELGDDPRGRFHVSFAARTNF